MRRLITLVFLLLTFYGVTQTRVRPRELSHEGTLSGSEFFLLDRADYSSTTFKQASLDDIVTYILANGGSGDITAVNTTSPILGGASSGAITLHLQLGGVNETYLDITNSPSIGDKLTYGGTDQFTWASAGGDVSDLGDLDDVDVTGTALGKVVIGDGSGEYIVDYPFYMEEAAGWGINPGSGASKKVGYFAPWTLDPEAFPISSLIEFPVAYDGSNARLLTFQQIYGLMAEEQIFLEIDPETTILMWMDGSNWQGEVIQNLRVTLWDGELRGVPILAGEQGDFTYTVNNCTAAFDNISSNSLFFNVTITTSDMNPISVKVTHTPSGSHKTWNVQWSNTGSTGGGGIGERNILEGAITSYHIFDGSITGDDIADNTITLANLGPGVSGTDDQDATEVDLHNYVEPGSTSDIATTDNVQEAIGKLESGLERDDVTLNDVQAATSNDFHSIGGTDDVLTDGEITALGYIKTYSETDPVYTAWDKDYDDLTNTPTIPSGNQVLDWTIDNGSTIHAGNYVDNNTTYTELQLDQDNVSLNDVMTATSNDFHNIGGTDANTQLSDGDISAMGYIKTQTDDQNATEVLLSSYVIPGSTGPIGASDAVQVAIGKLEKGLVTATAGGGDDNVQTDWDQTDTNSDDFLKNKPSIPSGNQILDWTTDQGAKNIHTGNYTNTTYTESQLNQDDVTLNDIQVATTSDFHNIGGTDDILSDGEIGAMGYIKTYSETDPVYTAWDKDYDDLTNTPSIPSGNSIK